MRVLLLALVVVLVAVGVFFWDRNQPATPPALPEGMVEQNAAPALSPPSAPSVVGSSPASGSEPARTPPAADALPPSVPGAPLLPGLAPVMPPAPGDAEVNPEKIAADLDELSLSMRDYRTLAAQNPVGTNIEITEALMGKNRTGARLAPQAARVNAKGEMMDRWGTAYFFHQVSATTMEIHSAGPDRKMGTDDDIIHQ